MLRWKQMQDEGRELLKWIEWEVHVVLPLMLEKEGEVGISSYLRQLPPATNAKTILFLEAACHDAREALTSRAEVIALGKGKYLAVKAGAGEGMDLYFSVPKTVSLNPSTLSACLCVEMGAHLGSPHELEILLVARGWPGTFAELRDLCQAAMAAEQAA